MFKNFGRSQSEDSEEEYIGNIWGWKFSRIALVVIIFFVIWVAIRYFQYKDKIQPEGLKMEQIDE